MMEFVLIASLLPACSRQRPQPAATVIPLGTGGGIQSLGSGVTIAVNPDALLSDTTFSVGTVSTLPGPLPAGFTAIGPALEITPSTTPVLDFPLSLTMTYQAPAGQDENWIDVLHWSNDSNAWETVGITSIDKVQHAITFDCASFSPFVRVAHDPSTSTGSYSTAFDPAVNGFPVANASTYLTTGGDSYGMSAYAVWFYRNHPADQLATAYSSATATELAQRAQASQSTFWSAIDRISAIWDNSIVVGAKIKGLLQATQQPQIMILYDPDDPLNPSDPYSARAVVAFAFDPQNIYFYDPYYPGQTRSIPYNESTGFGSYDQSPYHFVSAGYTTLNTWTNSLYAMRSLYSQASQGFTDPDACTIVVTSLVDGELVPGTSTIISGSAFGNAQLMPTSVTAYVGGLPYTAIAAPIGPFELTFTVTVPIATGTNQVKVFAGTRFPPPNGLYTGPISTLNLNLIGSRVPSSLLVTLTWSQDATDLDLYVTDPVGETAWYQNQQTMSRAYLDVDNTEGYGPEDFILSSAAGDAVLSGSYIIRVHFFSRQIPPAPNVVSGKVRILLNEGQDSQRLVTKSFTLKIDDASNDTPGSFGPDWVSIGSVDVINAIVTIDP
jgi:hypothetical protein